MPTKRISDKIPPGYMLWGRNGYKTREEAWDSLEYDGLTEWEYDRSKVIYHEGRYYTIIPDLDYRIWNH
jgi:hypothetical protein